MLGRKEPTMTDEPELDPKEKATADGMRIIEAVESKIGLIFRQWAGMANVIDAGRDAGLAGTLLAGELRGEARMIGGMIGELEQAVFVFHSRLSGIVDPQVPLPRPKSGSPR